MALRGEMEAGGTLFGGSDAGDARRPDLLEGLNGPQREAVMHGDGPLLILAGAGSGKTRAITRRIAWAVAERGVGPHEILAITFTNKAAGEMRERVAALIDAKGAWIGTFHAMCARILRRDIELLEGYGRDFTIYDTADRNALLRDLIKRAGFDVTRFRPAAVGAWISNEKNRYARAGESDGEGGLEMDLQRRVLADYAEAMRANNALDFDDLLLKVLELFDAHPGARDAYARRFRHVLVDEYQDTNRVQYLLMRHLAGFHGNLVVCGDPDQSIYAWRGADVRNILDFETDFPGARVVRLEQNYRSTQNILDAAQAVIRHNSERKEKELWSERGAGEKLVVVECGDEDDEAREVSLQIRALADRGARHDSMAIFYRANFMSRAVERALRLSSIPYQIVAGTEFYQRREVKDLIAYLRLMVNPVDDEAFKRAVNVPPRGVGDKSLEVLFDTARQRGESLGRACRS
ncbi:MAG TPA: UvrD-helicase domain-containing protein, partial [Planctomycetota bacterium]|nr:UvrD-helicase domain-containing protein [Planctomycetota bacterium]